MNSKIIEWLNINKLSLNKDKSKYIIFHMHKKEIPNLSLQLGNTKLISKKLMILIT